MQIIVDTRERAGIWTFSDTDEIIHKKLDTGDYSVVGLEDILCIERKKSISEFALNSMEPRFRDVLARMEKFQYRYIILEFTINDILKFPMGSGIPKGTWHKLRATPQFLMLFLSKIQVNHNIHVIFAGDKDNATYVAKNIMKRVSEKYGIK